MPPPPRSQTPPRMLSCRKESLQTGSNLEEVPMQGSRVRRPSPWLMLSLLALLLPAAWGCDRPGGSSGAGAAAPAGSSAEAEKTKKMEEKKADFERKAEEVRN